MSEIKKVVLAYSGGLDTSIIIPWLKEHYNNCEVIAVCGNVGQKGELEGLEERAKASGASKLYVEDLTDEFVEDYVIPTMQAGADYEGYLLGTSFARPILAKRVVEIARAEGADAVCHGSTGKGNDQVRFELAIMHFAPDLKIITPWREWDIQSRDEEIDYAEAHHIPLKISRKTNYSKDKNLWHLSHEGLDLEDPGNEPQYEKPGFLELGVSPKTAPDKCNKCGRCATVCPVGSIPADAPDTCAGICIKCHACIKICPTGAKYLDDPAFLSHVAMLEQNYTRPTQAEWFL